MNIALKRLLAVGGFTLLSTCLVQAQTTKITGRVTADEDNRPIPDATVRVKGKSAATKTNADGYFSIPAAPNAILVISYTGYAPQELAVQGTVVNASLKISNVKLDEVVVVGYGKQSRQTLSGAVSSVDPNVIKNAETSNVGTALQGTVPGLLVQQSTGQPGSSPNIVFRGGTNYDGSGSPLIVVDNIVEPSLYGLNMDDVETMTVLKDAASTAIYGARASNGVILITTRKGKRGRAQVTYTFRQTTNFVRHNPLKYLNGAQYIHMNRLGLQSSVNAYTLDGNTAEATTYKNVLTGSASTGWAYPASNAGASSLYSTELVTNANRNLIGNPMWSLLVDPDPFVSGQMDSILYRTTTVSDFESSIMHQATTQEHYLNLSGATEQGAFDLGLGATQDNGIVIGAALKRLSMNFNGGLNVGKNLKVTMNTSAYSATQILPYNTPSANSGTNGGTTAGLTGGFFQRIVGLAPTVRWTNDTSGAILPGSSDPTLGNPSYYSQYYNINNTLQQRFQGSLNIEYTILPYLKFLASGSGYVLNTTANSFTKSYELGTGGSYSTTRPASYSITNDQQYLYNAFLQFDKSFGAHHLSVLGGTEFYNFTEHTYSGSGQGAPTDFIPWLSASAAPSVVNGSILNPQSAYSDFDEWDRLASLIGRVNYSYKDKYFLTANFRYDGTSRLSTNRYGLFPGLSAGWNMQNEKFFQNSPLHKYVSVFKPRIGWGQNGSISALGYYATAQAYTSTAAYAGNSGSYASTLINSDLKWETSSALNIGADLGLFNNRISLIGDYFVRNVYNKISSIPIALSTGFSTFPTNLGQLQDRGYEFELTAKVLKPSANGLNIDLGANIAEVKTYIVKLPYNGLPGNRENTIQVWDPKNPGQVMQAEGLQQGQRNGSDAVYAPSYTGIYKTQADLTKDAAVYNSFSPLANKTIKQLGDARWQQIYHNDTIDSRQFTYVGHTTPDLTGGFTTNISYRGFTLYSQWDYALNFVILNNEKMRGLSQVQGSQNSSVDVLNTWSPLNPNGNLPRFYYANTGRNYGTDASGDNPAKQFWENGDYLMLRELSLSYELTPQTLQKALSNKIRGLRLFITGSNLKYFTKYDGTFPEYGGVDSGKYPLPKRLTLGITVHL